MYLHIYSIYVPTYILYLCTYIYTLSMYPIKFVGYVLYLCIPESVRKDAYSISVPTYILHLCTYIYALSMYLHIYSIYVPYQIRGTCTVSMYLRVYGRTPVSSNIEITCVCKQICQKRPIFSQKSPIFHQKSPTPLMSKDRETPGYVTGLIHMFGMTRIIEDRNHLWCTCAHVLFWENIAVFWYINFLLTLSLCERREFHPRCEKSHSGRQRAERLPTF